MKNEIEYWICKVMLKNFVLAKRPLTLVEPINQTEEAESLTVKEVCMIFRRPIGEDSNHTIKVHVRELPVEKEVLSIV